MWRQRAIRSVCLSQTSHPVVTADCILLRSVVYIPISDFNNLGRDTAVITSLKPELEIPMLWVGTVIVEVVASLTVSQFHTV
jgi:hypothetical protein